MTACVNRKHTKKVAAVVTASLVGALSLGVAPVAAMADDAAIETQAASKQDVFEKATITEALTTNRDAATFATDGTLEITASAEGLRGVYPTKMNVAGQSITLTEQGYEDGNYEVVFFKKGESITYVKDSAGNVISVAGRTVMPKAVGDYTAVLLMKKNTSYNGCYKQFNFRITPAEIGEVTVEDLVYNGVNQIVTESDLEEILKVNGKYVDLSKFTWTVDPADGDTSDGISRPVQDAGDYIVKLVGRPGTIYENNEAFARFNVAQLDLATADIVINDYTVAGIKATEDAGGIAHPAVYSINGNLVAGTALASSLVTNMAGSPTGSVDQPGDYTYTVSSTDKKNVKNSKDVTFDVVERLIDADNFFYSAGQLLSYYSLDNRRESFNTDLLKVVDDDGTALKFNITIKDANGNTVEPGNLKTPGVYSITLSVDTDHHEHKVGGKAVTKVRIIGGVVTSSDVYFSYNGVIGGNNATDTYDGTNLLDNLAVAVYDDLGLELKQGEDYDVTVKDADGNVLDQIVDAGTYTITVSSDTYAMANDTFTLKVNPVTVSNVRVSNLTEFGKHAFFPYTGSDITVELEYKDGDEWKALPADTYEIVARYSDEIQGDYNVVKAVNEVGFYEIYVHQAEGVKNYKIGATSTKGFIGIDNKVTIGKDTKNGAIQVSDAKVFTDVPTTYWAAQNIYEASRLGYMNGYNGTTFFGALDNIKRGDVVVTLFKMAGQPDGWQEDFQTSLGGFNTGFNDVDPGKYYAEAIAWAKAVGITTGDAGTNNFRPEDQISRQELAKMLCVYAEKTGKDVDVDTDAVLADYEDANTVSEWARDYVAWAVEADIMGQDSPLRGTDPINRAEVATMAVRLQPKKIQASEDLIPRA